MNAILESWEANATHWVQALEHEELETRRLVTNAAIVQKITNCHPTTMLDAGCGEGWLCRAMQQHGITTVGMDGVAELIHHARLKGPGHFEVASFEEMIAMANWPTTLFDGVVFNFCLYEQALTEQLLHKAIYWVRTGGKLFIQTLHPFAAMREEETYTDGWKQESWAGLKRSFSHPYRWYYRTVGSWLTLVQQSGWKQVTLEEPVHPKTGKPVSMIITAKK